MDCDDAHQHIEKVKKRLEKHHDRLNCGTKFPFPVFDFFVYTHQHCQFQSSTCDLLPITSYRSSCPPCAMPSPGVHTKSAPSPREGQNGVCECFSLQAIVASSAIAVQTNIMLKDSRRRKTTLSAQPTTTRRKQDLATLAESTRTKPDEFAFGMINSGRAGLGKHKSTHNEDENGREKASVVPGKPLSHDAVKLLKTQDAGYLRTVAAKGRREIERLGEDVGMDGVSGGKGVGRRTVFEDEVAHHVQTAPLAEVETSHEHTPPLTGTNPRNRSRSRRKLLSQNKTPSLV